MIYFKFPFDEKLYSTDESSQENHISYYSFDGLHQIKCQGNIIEISPEAFDNITISNELLSKDDSGYTAETKEEYIQNLHQVIDIIKEHKLPKLVYSRRKIFTDFNGLDIKESFKNLCKSYPNAFRYLLINGENSWMGAFSEVLGNFNKNTCDFETMSLAGTLPVSEKWSEKEIEEQKPVTSYIRDILNKYFEGIEESGTYDHISGNIKHLRTDFRVKIKEEEIGRASCRERV